MKLLSFNDFVNEFFDNKEYIEINEGGAGGHMLYPFELPEVKTGKDLIKVFNKTIEFLEAESAPLKIDGTNASVRLVTLDGKMQFVLDRGSNKELDVRGITKADLETRFGSGHGMISVGSNVLDIFNKSLPKIKSELRSLGLWDNPNILLNIEYVEDKTNVTSYDSKFIAIHNLLEINFINDKKRVSNEISYSQSVLDRLAEKMADIASKFNFRVFTGIPATLQKTPDIDVLNSPVTINFSNERVETKSLYDWATKLKIPNSSESIKWYGKKVSPLNKQLFSDISGGAFIEDGAAENKNIQGAVDLILAGYLTNLLMVTVGDEILSSMTSPLGDVKNQEGIVIRRPDASNTYKIVGSFIFRSLSSPFKKGSKLVTEGGNVFKNSGGTSRIKKQFVIPTVQWLEEITGLELMSNMLGSTGIKSDSGDIDLAVDDRAISKQQLAQVLKDWCKSNGLDDRDHVRKTGISVHFKAPIQGVEREFVQVDFMFGETEWMKWALRGVPESSKYKAVHRQVLMASIAKYNGLKWSTENGLLSRETGREITKDPSSIAKYLLGPGHRAKDLDSVESIMKAISKYDDREKMIEEAKETLDKKYGIKISF